MATIKNFEDLKAWQKAREVAGYVYELTPKQKFSRDLVCVIRFKKRQVQSCTILPKDLNQATTPNLRVF